MIHSSGKWDHANDRNAQTFSGSMLRPGQLSKSPLQHFHPPVTTNEGKTKSYSNQYATTTSLLTGEADLRTTILKEINQILKNLKKNTLKKMLKNERKKERKIALFLTYYVNCSPSSLCHVLFQ